MGALQDKKFKLAGVKEDPKGAAGEKRRLGHEGGDDVLLFNALFFWDKMLLRVPAQCALGHPAAVLCGRSCWPRLLMLLLDLVLYSFV